jgi:aspartate carbamoyltransferase catalytic subunit
MLKGKDILNAAQFSMEELDLIMNTAADLEKQVKNGRVLRNMEGKIVATLFFEPSTRTRLSFETAANRLGAGVISVANAASSSAADNAEHPFINAGDGSGQHPTQALLDIYTIHKEKGTLGGQTIAFVGDLRYGRTVHSLSYFMALYGNKMIFVSPESLRMPPQVTADLRARKADIEETEDLAKALSVSDIVYMTRVQRERFESAEEYERVKGCYVLNRSAIDRAKKGITVLHPLPRLDEISTDIDGYEGAAYFRQAYNGVYIRMALLALVSGNV